MKEYPIPTMEDANRFFAAFSTRHPEIAKLITSPIMDMTGYIDVFWNKDATETDKSIFARYRNRWLFDNGFADKQMDVVVLALHGSPTKSVREFNTESVISITGIDANISSITYKDDDMDKP